VNVVEGCCFDVEAQEVDRKLGGGEDRDALDLLPLWHLVDRHLKGSVDLAGAHREQSRRVLDDEPDGDSVPGQAERAVEHDLGAFELRAEGRCRELSRRQKPEAY
jgi:hypothetical protein